MGWQDQGRKEHGWFGDGHGDHPATVPILDSAAHGRRGAPAGNPSHGAPAHGHHALHGQHATGKHVLTPAEQRDQDVDDLAQVIRSEASGLSLTEKTVVGQILMNRLHRAPKSWTVEQVWGEFAHKAQLDDAYQKLARGIIDGSVADISQGATHFYSPKKMPMKGDSTKGFDVGGGLEPVMGDNGESSLRYRPSFAGTYPSVTIPGVDPQNFRIYRQPGNGRVY